MIRLLIVDDSALMRKMLEGIFGAAGDFDVRVARDGVEALALVRAFDPQVVTLDVQMPEMDGFEATAALRERDRKSGSHTTIVAMTAHAMRGDRERCLSAGMDDYISKPVDGPALLRMVALYSKPPVSA